MLNQIRHLTTFSAYALYTAFAASLLPFAANADAIQLLANDGSNSITGCLTRFESQTYELETELGRLVVSAEGFSCNGDFCPYGTTDVLTKIRIEKDENTTLSCPWLGS